MHLCLVVIQLWLKISLSLLSIISDKSWGVAGETVKTLTVYINPTVSFANWYVRAYGPTKQERTTSTLSEHLQV